jgi:hypothetical protein
MLDWLLRSIIDLTLGVFTGCLLFKLVQYLRRRINDGRREASTKHS